MAGGIPIRFRRTVNDIPIDPAPIGTPFWHMLDYRLGIKTELGMCWYPGIDSKRKLFVLNKDQRLTGRDSSGDKNTIAIDFSTTGQMNFVDLTTDTTLLSVTETGVIFDNPIVDEIVGGGSLSKGSHPGFVPSLFSSTPFDSTDYTGFIGPNTYLWKTDTNSGSLEASISYKEGSGALTHFSAETYTLKVDVASQLSGIGLRTWFFEPSLSYDGNSNKNKVFISVFGPSGHANTLRIGRNGSYETITILGNGTWQRIALEIPVHDRTQSYLYSADYEPFALDFVYNTSGGVWYFSEPTVQNVDTVTNEMYQYKSLAERCAMADSYYWETPNLYMEASRKKSLIFPMVLPVIHDNAICDVEAVTSTQVMNIAEASRNGIVVNTLDTNPSNEWVLKLRMGYRGPLTNL